MSALLFPLPESKPAVIRALILEDLAGFVYWPQVKHETQEDVRNRAHAKANHRRFDDEARVTAMGELA